MACIFLVIDKKLVFSFLLPYKTALQIIQLDTSLFATFCISSFLYPMKLSSLLLLVCPIHCLAGSLVFLLRFSGKGEGLDIRHLSQMVAFSTQPGCLGLL